MKVLKWHVSISVLTRLYVRIPTRNVLSNINTLVTFTGLIGGSPVIYLLVSTFSTISDRTFEVLPTQRSGVCHDPYEIRPYTFPSVPYNPFFFFS